MDHFLWLKNKQIDLMLIKWFRKIQKNKGIKINWMASIKNKKIICNKSKKSFKKKWILYILIIKKIIIIYKNIITNIILKNKSNKKI